jgi:hypothetical protein
MVAVQDQHSAHLANYKLAFVITQDLGKYLEKEDRPQPKEKGRYAKHDDKKHSAIQLLS